MNELQSGALLQGGKFRIDKSLGQGCFGITYLAEQTNLNRKVCIKEFFMKEYGERTVALEEDSQETVLTDGASSPNRPQNDKDATVLTGVSAVTSAAAEIMGRYKEKFVKEACTIARLDHPGVVRIHDVFEENGAAYYVMDFIEGENLNDIVKREGALSEERALGYIRQVADALSYVHGHNIMNLDVKPANIIVRKSDDKAILIDFGTSKQYDSEGSQTSTTPIGLSAGYAPLELMKVGGVQTFSPETDVYSLGATLYFLVTGQNPPDASERMEMIMEGEEFLLPDGISGSTAEVIEQSMQPRKKRIPNVSRFLELLDFRNGCKQLNKTVNEVLKSNGIKEKSFPKATLFMAEASESERMEAIQWYRNNAEKGLVDAQLNLGYCYYWGWGVQQDDTEAIKWYRKSAEQGFAEAQYQLGFCYDEGLGVRQNYSEAVKWYRKAAEQGDTTAQDHLGLCYGMGNGVPQSWVEAVKWHKRAAEQGDDWAQTHLGQCYAEGLGIQQDYAEAVKWYRRAAEQGNDEAQNNLGVCYVYGHGVDIDYSKAEQLFREADAQGNIQAELNLGRLLYNKGL